MDLAATTLLPQCLLKLCRLAGYWRGITKRTQASIGGHWVAENSPIANSQGAGIRLRRRRERSPDASCALLQPHETLAPVAIALQHPFPICSAGFSRLKAPAERQQCSRACAQIEMSRLSSTGTSFEARTIVRELVPISIRRPLQRAHRARTWQLQQPPRPHAERAPRTWWLCVSHLPMPLVAGPFPKLASRTKVEAVGIAQR